MEKIITELKGSSPPKYSASSATSSATSPSGLLSGSPTPSLATVSISGPAPTSGSGFRRDPRSTKCRPKARGHFVDPRIKGFGIKPRQSEDKKKRVKLLAGEIRAGNDNEELMREYMLLMRPQRKMKVR
jgi:hypothetical protein